MHNKQISKLDLCLESKYLYPIFFISISLASLIAGRFSFLLMLRLGETNEMYDRLAHYPFIYLIIFSSLFISLSVLYLALLVRSSPKTLPIIISYDLKSNLLFLLLFPYVVLPEFFSELLSYLPAFLTLITVIISKTFVAINAASPGADRSHRIYFLSILVSGFTIRCFLLTTSMTIVDSDEAIWGLMARNIIFLREHPTLFYGQVHMGSLSAYIAALVFLLFGASSMTLKTIPLLYSLAFMISVYLVGKKLASRNIGLVGMLLLAIGPSFFVFYNVTQWGYIEVLAIGNLILLLTLRLLQDDLSRKTSILYYAITGLLMGIGLWSSVYIFQYILATALVIILTERKRIISLKPAIMLLFIFIGLTPLIIFNIHNRMATIYMYLDSSGQADKNVIEKAAWMSRSGKALFTKALPGIIGLDRLSLFSHYLMYVLVLTLIVLAIYQSMKSNNQKHRMTALLLLWLGGVSLFSYVTTKTAAIYQVPRYLISLYSVLPLLISIALCYIYRRVKVIAVLALSLILIANLNGIYRFSQVKPPETVSLANTLENVGVTHALANYWLAYQLTFISKERITCAPHSGSWTHRYPEYNNKFDQAPPDSQALIFPARSKDIANVKRVLNKAGVSYSEISTTGYDIIFKFSSKISGAMLPDFEIGSDPRGDFGN